MQAVEWCMLNACVAAMSAYTTASVCMSMQRLFSFFACTGGGAAGDRGVGAEQVARPSHLRHPQGVHMLCSLAILQAAHGRQSRMNTQLHIAPA